MQNLEVMKEFHGTAILRFLFQIPILVLVQIFIEMLLVSFGGLTPK